MYKVKESEENIIETFWYILIYGFKGYLDKKHFEAFEPPKYVQKCDPEWWSDSEWLDSVSNVNYQLLFDFWKLRNPCLYKTVKDCTEKL